MLLDTRLCDVGRKAPHFDLPATKGESVWREGAMGEKALWVAFICNHCPYVKAIIERFVEDAKKLQASGIGVVAIMSNDYINYPDDSPEKMKAFADKHGFTFPYVLDEDQSVAKAYDAVCTPDFFGFNADGELHYRGRFDDVPVSGDPAGRRPELLNAMLEVAQSGKGPDEQVPSMGCSIKWK